MEREGTELSPRGLRTRERLLDAATSVFADMGEQRATLSDVARHCSMTPQAIYRYFPDKRALFEAALVRDEQVLAAEAARRTGDDPFVILTNARIEAVFELLPAHPLLSRTYAEGSAQDLELLLHGPFHEITARQLEFELALGQRAGVVRHGVDLTRLADSTLRMGVQVVMPIALRNPPLLDDLAAVEYVLITAIFDPTPPPLLPEEKVAFNHGIRAALQAQARKEGLDPSDAPLVQFLRSLPS